MIKAPYIPARSMASPLQAIPGDFTNGAIRAISAGFDAVEIHNANGFFFDRMLRSSMNPRTDAFGGSIENRTRLTLSVVEAVVSAIGSDKVGIRLSPNAAFDRRLDQGSRETFRYLMAALEKYNLAYIHITRPDTASRDEHEPSYVQLPEIRRMYNGVIVANGNFDTVEASQAISTGLADAISFARPFISNPDLVYRMENGLHIADPDRSTFYSPGREGYTDYPLSSNSMR
jgi:N-ethylmaleimide reductase